MFKINALVSARLGEKRSDTHFDTPQDDPHIKCGYRKKKGNVTNTHTTVLFSILHVIFLLLF